MIARWRRKNKAPVKPPGPAGCRAKRKSRRCICGGCVAPSHASQGKGSITPYGRIELDAIYSTRNTNPLDPGQFNGYATAAGKSSNTSATFNPRYSVFGVRADRTDGTHVLTGVVETDFYSQTDNAGNISPRLRLAYARYSRQQQQDQCDGRYGLDAGHGTASQPD